MNYKKEITIKELRLILFNVPDQDIMIKELRRKLFNVDNQDQIIRYGNLDFLLKGD